MPSSLAPLVSCFFHFCERTLMFMDVCITAAFGTVPRTVVTHTSVFHESDDVSVFVTKSPTDQKSGLFVIVDSATNKNSFQQSNNIARCFVSSLCFMWRVLFPPSSLSTLLFTKKFCLNPFGTFHYCSTG